MISSDNAANVKGSVQREAGFETANAVGPRPQMNGSKGRGSRGVETTKKRESKLRLWRSGERTGVLNVEERYGGSRT